MTSLSAVVLAVGLVSTAALAARVGPDGTETAMPPPEAPPPQLPPLPAPPAPGDVQPGGSAANPGTSADARSTERKEPDRRTSADLAYINGFGLQTDADLTSYYNELSLTGSYKATEWLTLSASISPYAELTSQPKDLRRFDLDPTFTYVRGDAQLYEDKRWTQVKLTGALTYNPPVGFNDRWDPRWGNVSGLLGLSRAFGPVRVAYSFGLTFMGYLSAVRSVTCVDWNDGATCRPAAYATAGYNPFFTMSNFLSAAWTATDKLSISARVGLFRTQSRGPTGDVVATFNPFPTNASYSYLSVLAASYKLNERFSFTLGFINGNLQLADGQNVLPVYQGATSLRFGIPGVFDTRTESMLFSVDAVLF